MHRGGVTIVAVHADCLVLAYFYLINKFTFGAARSVIHMVMYCISRLVHFPWFKLPISLNSEYTSLIIVLLNEIWKVSTANCFTLLVKVLPPLWARLFASFEPLLLTTERLGSLSLKSQPRFTLVLAHRLIETCLIETCRAYLFTFFVSLPRSLVQAVTGKKAAFLLS